MSEVTAFTVKRSQWLRGEGGYYSRLLRESDKKMCCLGFLAKACGATDEQILNKSIPGGVDPFDGWPRKLIEHPDDGSPQPFWAMMSENDKSTWTINKEEKLIEFFAKIGITLTFED
jgi:hypothetical protein